MTDKKQDDIFSIPFVNSGKEFVVPLIKVADIRAMQLRRSKVEDPDFRELEASITLAQSILAKVDSSVTVEMVENWEYSEFVKFIKTLWEKNAENFRGIMPTLPKVTALKK